MSIVTSFNMMTNKRRYPPLLAYVVFAVGAVGWRLPADALQPPLPNEAWKSFTGMSPSAVRAYEIEVMRKVADLALLPPRVIQSPGPEYDYDQLDYGMTPKIERTRGGRLWCVWLAGEDGPRAFLLAATSDDNGGTWSKPRLVIDSHSSFLPLPRTTLGGALWCDPLGRLWLFTTHGMNYFDGRQGIWAIVCEKPDADSPTWSAPRRISDGISLNKPIVLSTGEWLLPTHLLQTHPNHPGETAVDGTKVSPYAGPCLDFARDSRCPGPCVWGLFPELDPYRGVNLLMSTDHGETWTWRSNVKAPDPDWHEPMVVERRDGSLWMLIRVRGGIMETISIDRGLNWSVPRVPAVLRHPQSRFHLRRLASGRILFVKHGVTIDAHRGRRELSAWLSDDDGETWRGGLMLDERPAVSYPDAIQAPDGTIYIVHDRERIALGEILMSRVREEDILAGRITQPGSQEKRVIIRPLKKKTSKR